MKQEMITQNWRDFIRPRRLELDEGTHSATHARFSCEPLERGFGTTLGNALRRVLLSSLQGAAITSVKVAGVQHEFTTIPGVIEDMTDVILNLKEVCIRSHSKGSTTHRIHKTGEGVLTAGDLISGDSSVEILNPDHRIATFSAEADVEMEVTIGT